MNPEEEFEKWFKRIWPGSDPYPNAIGKGLYVDVKQAWLEAYRLGLTRAAEIVRDRGRGNPSSGTTPTGYRAIDPMITEQAILTERDKSDKP